MIPSTTLTREKAGQCRATCRNYTYFSCFEELYSALVEYCVIRFVLHSIHSQLAYDEKHTPAYQENTRTPIQVRENKLCPGIVLELLCF